MKKLFVPYHFFLGLLFVLFVSCSGTGTLPENRIPSRNPPESLPVSQVPMFVVLGFDDNPYSGEDGSGGTGGIKWVKTMINSKTNPTGNGNSATYDGTKCTFTLYNTTSYISSSEENGDSTTYVKKAWHDVWTDGNEIGSHTHSHPYGTDPSLSLTGWETEMQTCIKWLIKPFDPSESIISPDSTKGPGIPRSEIYGFRTPFLEYNANTFTALMKNDFLYDCSIEEGFETDCDGTNVMWPYTLNYGSPGHNAMIDMGLKREYVNGKEKKIILKEYPGLWELPTHVAIVPPDKECSQYGIPTGLRDKMVGNVLWFPFDKNNGKITGMDWELWFEFKQTKEEFLATLKYTFDQALKGNRAPLHICCHTGIYSSKATDSEEYPPNADLQARQEALEEFIDYVLTKPDTRVVSLKKMLDWVRNPKSL